MLEHNQEVRSANQDLSPEKVLTLTLESCEGGWVKELWDTCCGTS